MSTRTGYCNPAYPLDGLTNGYNPHERCRGPECSCECHQAGAPALTVESGPAPVGAAAIGLPGFAFDVPEEDYHRDTASLSHSGAKTILKAPAPFRWQQQHPVIKRAFDFGHAAHAKILGVGAPVARLDFPDRRTKAYKEAEEKARAAGQVPLLGKECDVVDAMADELSTHTLAMELLSEGQPEVSAYAVDEPTGVVRRCRFDWLGATILDDYKTADSADPAAFARKVAEYGYHQQHAWYLDLARDLGHPAKAFAFIVQSKNPPYLVSVVELSVAAVARGRELNRRALERYRDCTESGIWPGYVPDDRFASIDLPPWAYYDNDLEIPA